MSGISQCTWDCGILTPQCHNVKDITSDKSKTFNKLSIDQLNFRQDISLYRELQERESLSTDLNFGNGSTELKSEYLDVYEGIYAGNN